MTGNSDSRFSITISDGILECICFNPVVREDYIESIITTRLALSKGRSYPCLADFRNIIYISSKAIKRLTEGDSKQGISALAILVKNKLQRTHVDFFCLMNNHNFPLKAFTDKAEAIEWLKKFTNDNTI